MSVLALILVLCFLAGILWLVKYLFPAINPTIFRFIVAVVIIVAAILILQAFGVWDEIRGVKVPKI